MAEQTQDPATRPPDFRVSVEQSIAGLVDADAFAKGKSWLVAALIEALAWIVEKVLRMAAVIGGILATAIAKGEDRNQAAFGELAAVALQDMFGFKPNPAAMNDRGNRAARADAASQIGDMMLKAFSGQVQGATGGAIGPSDAPAKAFLNAMAQMALEGWLEGWLVEACTLGQLETFGDLDDTISQVLGLGRASAAVHGPLVKHMIVDPLEWKINQEHRPTLLTESLAVRQYLRGRWTREQLEEELSRQGWSAERIEAHINAQRKFLSPDEALLLAREGVWTLGDAQQHLKDQGYEDAAAHDAIVAVETRRLVALRDDSLAALRRSYTNREISDGEFTQFLSAIISDDAERAAIEVAARTVRDLNQQFLSSAQAAACVKAGILAVPDYRQALRREGYTEEAVLSLELLLRYELDKNTDIEFHRREALAARAVEQQAKAAAAAKRIAEVEQERALARRGSLADLKRAVVRGLIPIARYQEVLTPQYDADTVQILTEDAEIDRQTYLAAQAAADEARKRGAQRQVSIADLETAVVNGVLTPDEFARGIAARGFSDADVSILRTNVQIRAADANAAKAKRAAADKSAKQRSVDLGRFEQLVRRGVRTFAQYEALLQSLDFDEAARADILDLLRLKVADDEAARQARAEAADADAEKGLTLEQLRRGVVLGLAPEDAFSQFLQAEDYTADAQILLLGELRDDVAEAEAARQRRAQADPVGASGRISLAALRRAVRLGVVDPPTYEARLVAAGWSADDIAIELQLVFTEIADVQGARTVRDTADAGAAAGGLTLAELARAVRAGVRHLEDYRAALAGLNLPADVIATQVRVLADELEGTKAAKARRESLVGEVDATAVPIAELEAQVRAGGLTLADYRAILEQKGIDPSDAELLGGLLRDELDGAAA